MRGPDHQMGHLRGYVNPETMVPQDHPLRVIRPLVNAALERLSPDFDEIYSPIGRPSIPPEQVTARFAAPGVLHDPLGAAVDGAIE